MRAVTRGLLATVTLAALGAAGTAGCSGQPSTGSQVSESPEQIQKREDSVKSAMESGAYGAQYKPKAAPRK